MRVLAAQARIEPGMLEPYAIVTARNVIATMWRDADRRDRNLHKVVDLRAPEAPEEPLLAEEEQAAIALALDRLGERERQTLLAHEVAGQDTGTPCRPDRVDLRCRGSAAEPDPRPDAGGVPARSGADRTADRPVSAGAVGPVQGDRRRQREVDAAGHVLTCDLCARLSEPLTARGQSRDDVVRIPINRDADIVSARQAARELAGKAGLAGTDLTLLATAVSEVVRNIVRFTERRRDRRRGGRAGRSAWGARGGARYRPGHRRHRAGDDRRVQHVCRSRTWVPGRQAAHGRVRRRIRGGSRDNRDHDHVVEGRTRMTSPETITCKRHGRWTACAGRRGARRPVQTTRTRRPGTRRTGTRRPGTPTTRNATTRSVTTSSSCCRSWWPTCVTSREAAGGVGQPDP